MTWLQALAVALLQGGTEMFPVSSLGHAVVVPAVLNSGLDQRSHSFLPFLVLLHLGTAVALLSFFWRDWWAMARGVLGLAGAAEREAAVRLLVLIVIATIPAVILGFTLNKYVRALFASPLIACGFLVLNGVMLLTAERLRRGGARDVGALTARDALIIGCWQCLALLPGISRSGATIVGGLLRGVNHAAAARFSFLIATPIILGATVLEVPKLAQETVPEGVFVMAAVAAVVAGVVAWLTTWLLMRHFRAHDDWALDPFGYYCIAFGGAAFAWLYFA